MTQLVPKGPLLRRVPIDSLQRAYHTDKFKALIDHRERVVYFINANPRDVIKVDGEHTYLWFRDPRINPLVTLIE